jgi:hypothetical protein
MSGPGTTSPLAKYKLVRWKLSKWCVQLLDFCSVLLQVFLGDQSVGKTSIITRFMYDKFDNTYQVGCSWDVVCLCSFSVSNNLSSFAGHDRD